MSDVPKNDSLEPSEARSEAQQVEQVSQRAEIYHDDGRQENVEIQAQRYWSGSLPRPEDFAKYADIVPDAPERILRMAEKEQDHRIDLERQIVPANNTAGKRGQWLGAIISILALILAAVSSFLGAPWQVSTALVSVPVLSVARSLVSAFRSSGE